MTDLTMYPVKNQIQAIKSNGEVTKAIQNGKNWQEVKNLLHSIANVSKETEDYFYREINKQH